MTLNKSTHGSETIEMWQPVVKNNEGKYIAILSDDSVDRDNEIIGKQALQGIMNDDGYTAILLNHKNDIELQIGEWVNKRIEQIGEHHALVAEPKFYLSNPKAAMIKGMLDEGAKMGISIGAIPTSAVEKKCSDGKTRKEYTGLELLEASFVAIPSNRHGRAMAVSKSLDSKKMMETKTMETEQDTKAEYSELEKSFEEYKAKKEAEIEALKKELEELTVAEEEAVAEEDLEEEAEVEAEEELEAEEETEETVEPEAEEKAVNNEVLELKKQLETVTKELEQAKKMPVHKAEHSSKEGTPKAETAKGLPILRL